MSEYNLFEVSGGVVVIVRLVHKPRPFGLVNVEYGLFGVTKLVSQSSFSKENTVGRFGRAARVMTPVTKFTYKDRYTTQ